MFKKIYILIGAIEMKMNLLKVNFFEVIIRISTLLKYASLVIIFFNLYIVQIELY